MKNKEKIFVTKTFLPPLNEYVSYLEMIWKSRWITNSGALAKELEKKLEDYLKVKHVILVSNGTIALQLAIKALDIKKEIITTPFSFAATTTSIIWENCKPVFVDINPHTFSIDEEKIEKAITKNTQAILAVHVYGYPSNVKKIQRIAKKHNLKVIYDAAHAFDVKIDNQSIFKFGDISTLSLHATKLFHSAEGGLILTDDDKIAERIEKLKDFGLDGEIPVEVGINGKNSEFHAGLALANFKYIKEIKNKRKLITNRYIKNFNKTNLHNVTYLKNVDYNYAYFPVVFETEKDLLKAQEALKAENIFARRYFYPSLNTLSFIPYQPCPISESIAKRVLCLPLYHDLGIKNADNISKIILNSLKTKKPTLTIGIPAYNEEKNIQNLIKQIQNQNSQNYTLQEIIVNSDSSSDNTVTIVKQLAKKDRRIKILDGKQRRGKAYRLNELYQIHHSDYLLTLDGDVKIENKSVVEKLINVFLNDDKALVTAAHLTPIKPKTFIGKIIFTNDLLWENIRIRINNGDHIANLYGAATMLEGKFSKKIKYPTNISCDEEFLYIKAKEEEGFRYSTEAKILFMAPSTIKDVFFQGRRALKERESLTKLFNIDIDELHNVPTKYKLEESLKMLIINPIYTFLALILMILFRIIPYEDKLIKEGMWRVASSTKELNKY